mmetsp:Transcript_27687/g.20793  ORF Transcript_27687/g.20793 Transcript_27687/m.20793 type:complete len:175 (+) Transcript_27687:119-643(+)
MMKDAFEAKHVTKDDFTKFVKIFKSSMGESDISDMYYFLGKKLSPLQSQDKHDTFSKSSAKDKGRRVSQPPLTPLSDKDLRDWRLDLALMDLDFLQWFSKEESLNGVLNMKVIKGKNADLKLKLEAWKRRNEERKRLRRRTFEQGKKLRAVFEKSCSEINIEKEKVKECVVHYN